MPTVSNVNFTAGEAVANRVTVGVGTGGQIEVYNHTGTVNVDIDVDGYYAGQWYRLGLRADHPGPCGRHPHGQLGR